MRISQYFNLGVSQAGLDFVDVDTLDDTPLFIDPHAVGLTGGEMGELCAGLLSSYFGTILALVKNKNKAKAINYLSQLKEPKETRLGLSRKGNKGRAVGQNYAEELYLSLARSAAASTGLVKHLEDTALLIPGIGIDIVSDIATNVMRGILIEYTQNMCSQYEIPMSDGVTSGPLWNPKREKWVIEYVKLPTINHSKLLLVPKIFVRYYPEFSIEDYYRDYIIEKLREIEFQNKSELVQILKNGTKRVTRKNLESKYGSSKETVIDITLRNPELFEKYKAAKSNVTKPVSIEKLLEIEGQVDNVQKTLSKLSLIPIGNKHAHEYENVIYDLLGYIFYPHFTHPQKQVQLHQGRKRVDITFDNVAKDGFFQWLAVNYRAPKIFVECKNYGADLGNPELDQIMGRFSKDRGKFGIICCRGLKDKDLFMERCRDTAKDRRGFIIVLDDTDFTVLVEELKMQPSLSDSDRYEIIRKRFEFLIS